MAFLSNLIGRQVADVEGEMVGKLVDLIACKTAQMSHPEVIAIVVKRGRDVLIVPFTDVAVLVAPAIPLRHKINEITPYQPGEKDLYLVRDVLDKQIIDTNGVRVVRVNDLELARVNGSYYVANVDIGGLGLLRRLGLAKVAQRTASRLARGIPDNVVSWDEVELITSDETVRLKVPGERISELHPADLAEIISDLSRSQTGDLLETLDVKTLADTLEEVEPDFQANLVESMPDEKVADVLEEMAPDEAADLLAELPKDRSEDLLELMEDEEAKDVRKLLAYPEDSAGGIMTTEFVAVRPGLTAGQAIEVLRETSSEAETMFYVYVTEESGRLVGVFSLKDLVLSRPSTPVTDFMTERIISVDLLDSQEEVAQLISKYNLLAIPVVDDQGIMHGIVTADDALDKIIPTAWKKRLPRLYR